MYIPGADGSVYHFHENDILAICTKAKQVPDVPPLKEGIRLRLPKKIDWSLVQRFISIARYYGLEHQVEFHSEVYWNLLTQEYRLVIPKQKASLGHVEATSNFLLECPSIDWIKVMEIHSHHVWEATPSLQDDESERQTILYAIVGKIDEFFPQITVRTFFQGKHLPINPWEVFESPFPTCTESLSQVEIVEGRAKDDSTPAWI